MANDLIVFLRARLDAEGQLAQLVASRHVRPENADDAGASFWPTAGARAAFKDWAPGSRWADPGLYAGLALIETYNPARVLSEVAAKRAIIDLHVDRAECTRCEWFDDELYPCDTLKLLAQPYAGHRDYRKEWTP